MTVEVHDNVLGIALMALVVWNIFMVFWLARSIRVRRAQREALDATRIA
jgi:hypothetical protein